MQIHTTKSILLIEDDERLSTLVSDYLSKEGFAVQCVYNGLEALERLNKTKPDLVILDWMLPGLDGFSICKKIRAYYQGAVLMLTAKSDDIDQVLGLEVGADDYVVKPVQPRVLLARINALLRRTETAADIIQPLDFGDLNIKPAARSVHLKQQIITLTDAEFDLLLLLATHAGSTLSRDLLFKTLSGIEYDGTDRAMDMRISVLRRLLNAETAYPHGIKTVRGKGYMLNPDGWKCDA